MSEDSIEARAINTIRFLSADAVENANSGHPGLPMGVAPIAYVLWTRHLKFDPQDPAWPDRDRFVLSAGHGSALLYSMLHLTGYDLPMEQLKNFRQWGSHTPGHPEYGDTPGVETTTGPLGQGFGNGVGMAIAAHHLAAEFNREGFPIVDHNVYAIVSDGDLMEGVASEAASLAGHLKLGRLVYVYDDNRISIDGSTDLTFTEDRAKRFEAYGWHVLHVEDGNDIEAVDQALDAAKGDPRPSLIICRTHIGYGLPTRQDTAEAHGKPPGQKELLGAKDKLGWPKEPLFLVPEDVRAHMGEPGERGAEAHRGWDATLARYQEAHPDLSAEFERRMAGKLPGGYAGGIEPFPPDEKGMATRASSGATLNALAPSLPELMGGSADLTGSNKTDIKGEGPFTAEDRSARYLYFGVREHAMGAILNGLGLHGGLIPYGGTFLIFSDYMRPTIRLAAMMGVRLVYVFTHDSIGLGEDGPTHQPVEHVPSLRAVPNLTDVRPADANEVAVAWQVALENERGPTALVLTRQKVPTLDRKRFAPAEGLRRGAYVLADLGDRPTDVILMASGSEVQLIVQAGEALAKEGIGVRLVSFPSWALFSAQEEAYKMQVLPRDIRARVAVEAAVPLGWERWVGDQGKVIGIDRFGASAPYQQIYQHLGLTAERIVAAAEASMRAARQLEAGV